MSTSISSRSSVAAHWARRHSKSPRESVPHDTNGRVWAVERWLVRRLLRSLGDPPIALVLWDGEPIGHSEPHARVIVHDCPTFWRLVCNPDLHFGDAYSEGRVEVNGDLLAFLELVYRAEDERPRSGLAAMANRMRRERLNTIGRADRTSTTTTTSATTSTGSGLIAKWFTRWRTSPRPTRRWKRADGQDGPRLPQALAQAGRDGRRGGLRLGGVRAAHGSLLRRHRQGL